MALYDILGLASSTVDTSSLQVAANRCRDDLREKCPPTRLDESLHYIDSIEYILGTKEGRECYDNIVQSYTTYISPLRASLILKRVSWFNACSKVSFGDSFLDRLREISTCSSNTPSLLSSQISDLNCRWCEKKLLRKEIDSVVCKCDSRCGHTECLQTFLKQHRRCPVCRSALLRRNEVSKYMFFCKDPKYIIN